MAKSHAKGRVSAYVRLLRRFEAPEKLVDDFLDIVAIDNSIATDPSGSLESLDRLLFDVCRRFNFTRPFDRAEERASFRPCLLDYSDPGYAADAPQWFDNAFDPKVEQAYRRGYDHGFSSASQMSKKDALLKRAADIRKWRRSRVFYGSSFPGSLEPFGLKATIRSSIPAKLRWAVLSRDGHRCVSCGASPDDGAKLHLDHIISVYNGGQTELSNLQTLCEPCNLGKGRD